MLLITTPDPYALSGHGHCEAGAPGRDIVCAAASCLLDAYAARLQELDIPLRLRQGPGLLEIQPRHIPRRLRRDGADRVAGGPDPRGGVVPRHIDQRGDRGGVSGQQGDLHAITARGG